MARFLTPGGRWRGMRACESGLALILMGLKILAPALLGQQVPANHQTAGSAAPLILVDRVGPKSLSDQSAASGCPVQPPYLVNIHEEVYGQLKASYPQPARLHALLRREHGGREWDVQAQWEPATMSSWRMDLRFGGAADGGELFDLRFVVTRDPLPPGPVPQGLLERNTLARSEVIRLRRNAGVTVWVSRVAGKPVVGDDILNAYTVSKVDVGSANLPPGALIGVAVEPVYPEWTRQYWIMDDAIASAEGSITTHFGELFRHNFFDFDVYAFAACKEDFPRRGVPISFQEWESARARFFALSRAVRATKWERDFLIRQIDDSPVGSRGNTVHEVADIRGTIARPLDLKEEIWIVCSYSSGAMWIAGSTDKLLSGGRWVVRGATVWKPGTPRKFNIFGVISPVDLWKNSSADLPGMVNHLPQSDNTVVVTAEPSRP